MSVSTAEARQLSFQKQYRGTSVIFSYKWRDMYNKTQNMAFKLGTRDIEQGIGEWKVFDNKEANNYAVKAVQKAAKAESVDGTTVNVERTWDGYRIAYRGASDAEGKEVVERMAHVRDRAYETYLFNNFYSRVDDQTIMPDHRRIAHRYVAAMQPVADAIR